MAAGVPVRRQVRKTFDFGWDARRSVENECAPAQPAMTRACVLVPDASGGGEPIAELEFDQTSDWYSCSEEWNTRPSIGRRGAAACIAHLMFRSADAGL